MTETKVIIVEDDPDIGTTLERILNISNGMRCIAVYQSAEDLLKEVHSIDADLILMDISLPGISGIEATRNSKVISPHLEILILSVHDEDQMVFDALSAGAIGYVLKNTPTHKIVTHIKEAMNGGSPMSQKVARKVVDSFHISTNTIFTTREIEVLQKLCNGLSYKLIADSLYISQDTVRSHIKSIYRKLHVNSKSEAIIKAMKNRIV